MDTLLVRERYKVVQVLEAREDYAFAEAVDILDREHRSCLLNIYEGPLLRIYVDCFDRMKGCPAFLDVFAEGGSLVTVFETCEGKPIDHVFFRGDRHDWRTRMDYAGKLLHAALNMADLPVEVSCAAMLSENVRIDENDQEVHLRFRVSPMVGMNPRELVYLTGDQLGKILLPRFGSPVEQLELLDDFRDRLSRGSLTSVVQLYSLWQDRRGQIEEAYEKLEKMNFVRRWIALAWGRVKRRMTRSR